MGQFNPEYFKIRKDTIYTPKNPLGVDKAAPATWKQTLISGAKAIPLTIQDFMSGIGRSIAEQYEVTPQNLQKKISEIRPIEGRYVTPKMKTADFEAKKKRLEYVAQTDDSVFNDLADYFETISVDTAKKQALNMPEEMSIGQKFVYDLVANFAPQIVGTVVAVATGNPMLAGLISFPIQWGTKYNEHREAGMEPEQAMSTSLIQGGIEAVLENITVGTAVKYVGSIPKKILNNISSEAIQEALQTTGERIVDTSAYNRSFADEAPKILAEAAYSALLGAVMGIVPGIQGAIRDTKLYNKAHTNLIGKIKEFYGTTDEVAVEAAKRIENSLDAEAKNAAIETLYETFGKKDVSKAVRSIYREQETVAEQQEQARIAATPKTKEDLFMATIKRRFNTIDPKDIESLIGDGVSERFEYSTEEGKTKAYNITITKNKNGNRYSYIVKPIRPKAVATKPTTTATTPATPTVEGEGEVKTAQSVGNTVPETVATQPVAATTAKTTETVPATAAPTILKASEIENPITFDNPKTGLRTLQKAIDILSRNNYRIPKETTGIKLMVDAFRASVEGRTLKQYFHERGAIVKYFNDVLSRIKPVQEPEITKQRKELLKQQATKEAVVAPKASEETAVTPKEPEETNVEDKYDSMAKNARTIAIDILKRNGKMQEYLDSLVSNGYVKEGSSESLSNEDVNSIWYESKDIVESTEGIRKTGVSPTGKTITAKGATTVEPEPTIAPKTNIESYAVRQLKALKTRILYAVDWSREYYGLNKKTKIFIPDKSRWNVVKDGDTIVTLQYVAPSGHILELNNIAFYPVGDRLVADGDVLLYAPASKEGVVLFESGRLDEEDAGLVPLFFMENSPDPSTWIPRPPTATEYMRNNIGQDVIQRKAEKRRERKERNTETEVAVSTEEIKAAPEEKVSISRRITEHMVKNGIDVTALFNLDELTRINNLITKRPFAGTSKTTKNVDLPENLMPTQEEEHRVAEVFYYPDRGDSGYKGMIMFYDENGDVIGNTMPAKSLADAINNGILARLTDKETELSREKKSEKIAAIEAEGKAMLDRILYSDKKYRLELLGLLNDGMEIWESKHGEMKKHIPEYVFEEDKPARAVTGLYRFLQKVPEQILDNKKLAVSTIRVLPSKAIGRDKVLVFMDGKFTEKEAAVLRNITMRYLDEIVSTSDPMAVRTNIADIKILARSSMSDYVYQFNKDTVASAGDIQDAIKRMDETPMSLVRKLKGALVRVLTKATSSVADNVSIKDSRFNLIGKSMVENGDTSRKSVLRNVATLLEGMRNRKFEIGTMVFLNQGEVVYQTITSVGMASKTYMASFDKATGRPLQFEDIISRVFATGKDFDQIIVVHNHPGGNLQASGSDLNSFNEVEEFCKNFFVKEVKTDFVITNTKDATTWNGSGKMIDILENVYGDYNNAQVDSPLNGLMVGDSRQVVKLLMELNNKYRDNIVLFLDSDRRINGIILVPDSYVKSADFGNDMQRLAVTEYGADFAFFYTGDENLADIAEKNSTNRQINVVSPSRQATMKSIPVDETFAQPYLESVEYSDDGNTVTYHLDTLPPDASLIFSRKIKDEANYVSETDVTEETTRMVEAELKNAKNPLESAEKEITTTNKIKGAWERIFARVAKADLYMSAIARVEEKTGVKFWSSLNPFYNKYANVMRNYLINTDKLVKDLKLTQEDGRHIYLYALQQQSEKGRYDKVLELMGVKDPTVPLKLTDAQMKYYNYARSTFEKLHPEVKAVAEKLGDRFGYVKNYFPVVPVEEDSSFFPILDQQKMKHLGDDPLKKYEVNGKMRYVYRQDIDEAFMKTRMGAGAFKVVPSAFAVVNKYVDDATYYINCAEEIKRLATIISHPLSAQKMGVIGQEVWLEWIDAQARRGGSDNGRIQAFDTLRMNYAIAIFGFKLSSSLLQLGSVADTISGTGVNNFWLGAKMTVNQAWIDFIHQNAEEAFAIQEDITLAEASKRAELIRLGFAPLVYMDRYVRINCFLSWYSKWCADHGVELDASKPNAEGVNYALAQTIRTQGSSTPKNQNVFVTKGLMGKVFGGNLRSQSITKLLMMFQNFPLTRFHNQIDSIWTHGLKEKRFIPALESFWWLTIVATALELFSRNAIKDALDEIVGRKPDDRKFWNDLTRTMLGNIPFGGTIIGSSAGYGEWIPVLRVFTDTAMGANNVFTGKTVETRLTGAIQLVQGVGSFTGIPGTYQAADILKKIKATVKE